METKKYKTAAAMRRTMEERLAAERLDLAANDAEQKLIEARIFMIVGPARNHRRERRRGGSRMTEQKKPKVQNSGRPLRASGMSLVWPMSQMH